MVKYIIITVPMREIYPAHLKLPYFVDQVRYICLH